MIKTKNDIKNLGSIVFIAAHPDDESWLGAGIMSVGVAQGQKVACITATKGEAGSQNEERWPTSKLAEIRTAELQASLKIIGVSDHTWLGYKDGECEKVKDDEAVAQILPILERVQPDSIFTFGSEGMTGHPDHISVSRWAGLANQRLKNPAQIYWAVQTENWYEEFGKEADTKLNAFYNIDQPPFVPRGELAVNFDLPAEIQEQKIRALEAQPSQIEIITKTLGRDWFFESLKEENFVLAS